MICIIMPATTQVAVVESYARVAQPKRLNDVLRLEYRSKLLNPKWANTMVRGQNIMVKILWSKYGQNMGERLEYRSKLLNPKWANTMVGARSKYYGQNRGSK